MESEPGNVPAPYWGGGGSRTGARAGLGPGGGDPSPQLGGAMLNPWVALGILGWGSASAASFSHDLTRKG